MGRCETVGPCGLADPARPDTFPTLHQWCKPEAHGRQNFEYGCEPRIPVS